MLQSGEDGWYTASKIVELISSIKKLFPDVAVTLSLGERSYEEYKLWYESRSRSILLRHETASRRLCGEASSRWRF